MYFTSNVNTSPSFRLLPVNDFVPSNVTFPVAVYVFTKSNVLLLSLGSTFSVPSPLSETVTVTVYVFVSTATPAPPVDVSLTVYVCSPTFSNV